MHAGVETLQWESLGVKSANSGSSNMYDRSGSLSLRIPHMSNGGKTEKIDVELPCEKQDTIPALSDGGRISCPKGRKSLSAPKGQFRVMRNRARACNRRRGKKPTYNVLRRYCNTTPEIQILMGVSSTDTVPHTLRNGMLR